MKRSERFLLFSLGTTLLLFSVFRTPFIIYMGLLYSLVLYTSKEGLRSRGVQLDIQTIVGASLVVISPMFLIVKINGYSSPSTFHALLLLGLELMLFEWKESLTTSSILAMEATIVITAKTEAFKRTVNSVSRSFVDMTSHLVRGIIDISNVPIIMRGNVAIVRHNIVVIGSGCSGLDAFVLYILAALVLIIIRKSNKREAALLLLGAVGIVPLNALRIFILLVIGYHSGISFLEIFHSHLGDLMFVAYVSLYWWAVLRATTKGKEGATSSGGQ